jgi:hypothetical protein
MKKIYLVLFAVVVVVAACKDDDPKLTTEQLLTKPTNGWIYSQILITVPGSTTQIDVLTDPDFADYYQPCNKDDATIFKADKTYLVANNTKCDASEDATLDSGTWALSSDQKTITLTSTDTSGGSSPDLTDLKIDEITETSLKVEATVQLDLGTGSSTSLTAIFVMKPKS